IRSGLVTALYLFDVAGAIDIEATRKLLGGEATIARFDDKTAGPTKIQYTQPPVVADGRVFGCAELAGFRVRVKAYDYGVISLMLSKPFTGNWSHLVSLGQSLIESEPLEDDATAACRRVVAKLSSALTDVRKTFLSEDYLVFAVTDTATPETSASLLDRHGTDIAQLLRGERAELSEQEREAVLRYSLSYLATDLVVTAWNAAFVFDTEPGTRASIEILELANSQLLEFRYHDDLLETEMTRIYAELQVQR